MSKLTPERREEIERDARATIGYTSATSAEPSWTMLENSPSGHKRKLAAHIRFLLHVLASAEQTIARLTTEREALTTFFHEGQRLEIGQLRADIAAARSSLGSIALTLRGLAALHQGDEHPILEEELLRIASAIDEDEVARLGTGEALAAVRMAQEVLQQYEWEVGAVLPDGSKSGVALALTLLKAMFGEGG